MATRKKATPRKAPVKAKATQAKVSADDNRKIKGSPGMDEFFYPKFPRFAAYQILVKAKNRTLKVSTFIKKVEALPDVKTHKQALGIVQKLVDKKRHCGSTVAAFV